VRGQPQLRLGLRSLINRRARGSEGAASRSLYSSVRAALDALPGTALPLSFRVSAARA
jgi:hypothetical protein